jgi:hypothetical protein
MKTSTNIKEPKKWTFARVISSSNIILIFSIIIIAICLIVDVPNKNKFVYLGISFFLFFYLWINVLTLASRTTEGTYNIQSKVKKLLKILFAMMLIYAAVYHAIYTMNNDYFLIQYTKSTTSYETYFDMFYQSSFFTMTTGLSDVVPLHKIPKTIVLTQYILTVILLTYLLSKAIN